MRENGQMIDDIVTLLKTTKVRGGKIHTTDGADSICDPYRTFEHRP
jgi:hypothetical protein